MEITRKSCRLCLSESEFNVSINGSYGRRTNIVDKILVCLKIVIEENDRFDTICYNCAANVERYYDFITFIKKSQTKLVEPQRKIENSVNRRLITSYVREQVFDADYTFSFLEMPEEKKEAKESSPFFSYFSPPMTKRENEQVWKTPKARESLDKTDVKNDKMKRQYRCERPRQHSRDLFESQSQEVDDDLKPLDWKLTPDDNIIKRVRDRCFGRSQF